MECRILWFGKILVEDSAVTIKGVFSEEKIPYQRISSVSSNGALSRVTISTSGQERTVQLWNGARVKEVAEAVNERLGENLVAVRRSVEDTSATKEKNEP